MKNWAFAALASQSDDDPNSTDNKENTGRLVGSAKRTQSFEYNFLNICYLWSSSGSAKRTRAPFIGKVQLDRFPENKFGKRRSLFFEISILSSARTSFWAEGLAIPGWLGSAKRIAKPPIRGRAIGPWSVRTRPFHGPRTSANGRQDQ